MRVDEYSRHVEEFKIAIEKVDDAETEDREEPQPIQDETTPSAWKTIADEIAERLTKFERAASIPYASKVEKAKEFPGSVIRNDGRSTEEIGDNQRGRARSVCVINCPAYHTDYARLHSSSTCADL